MSGRHAQRALVVRARRSLRARLLRPLLALAVTTSVVASVPRIALAGVFSFSRTDYLLQSSLSGLDSVAVADVDGIDGPDIVALSYTGGASASTVNVLLNQGDGTFAPALHFAGCDGASALVVGQLNPQTDTHLDVAMICGNQQTIGRMLGDGQGGFAAPQTLGVGYLSASTGSPYVSIVSFLRLGAMDGPTLVYAGYMAGLGQTLCFLRVSDLEQDLDHSGSSKPVCNVHVDDVVGSPTFGQVDDFGPVASDIALGDVVSYVGQSIADEALSGSASSVGSAQIPLALTAYTPFFASTWSYGSRGSGNTGTAVAIADLDRDGQNDLLIGGTDLAHLATGDGTIADYVPGWPIAEGASPTHASPSVAYLYDMVTADFDRDGRLDVAAVGEDDTEDDGITVAVQRGAGDGTFAAYERFPARGYAISPQAGQVIAVGDFDRNGSPDLVTLGEADKYATLLLNGAAEPQTTITTMQSVFTTTGSPVKVRMRFIADVPGATFACKLNQLAPVQVSGTWAACTSPWAKKLGLGKYRLLVRATDAAHHTDPTPARKKFKVKLP